MILPQTDGNHKNMRHHVTVAWPFLWAVAPALTGAGTRFGPSGPCSRVRRPREESGQSDSGSILWPESGMELSQGLSTLDIYPKGSLGGGIPGLWEVGPGRASCHYRQQLIARHFLDWGSSCTAHLSRSEPFSSLLTYFKHVPGAVTRQTSSHFIPPHP